MTDKNKTSGTDKNTSAPASSSGKETPSSSNTAASSQPSNSKPSNAEKKTASTPPEAKPAKEQKRGGNKLAAVAIILVIALGAGLYYHGHQQSQQYNADISALASQVDALKSALSDSEKQNQAALASAAQNTQVLIKQQDKTIVSLQSALADMKGRRPNDWLLAEAEYLVNQAGRQLWLVHDVLTATTLMENADQRIAELNDPSMTPIRQAMAKDIMQLKALKRIDRDGLVLRLNSLQQEVDTLPLANAIMPQAEEVAPEKVSSDVSDWEQNLKASMNDFVGKFITYRKREGDVVPLLTPAQTFYLQENLKAKLDQAITAVYRENGRLYAESLSTAKAWAERFYNQDAKSTEAFITTLTHLSEQTISVNYPEVLHSQDLISEALSERLRRDLSPLPAEAEALPTEESTQ
ncbi:heme biosynthesis operon protein HemX [Enterovibrio norvegicus]|uniref:Uroporphyrinogen-III C-methyltransferase n=1 Tax=Enterovibrio norvegicus TaxID=188144 RepID=A0ABV4L0G4_9GAMM|nr:uroporphyrinogen-III C-methyltransferase [Enterovibrio norvegicus]MCC4797493.1 uroporphyrinogen-III C-methyltransferase [Enterovibrio norvegicus]OEE68635.1 heme biosynthesis operon protein HemX [Enterovibrio norvegicus]OEF59918.1 heme biosynthesis operon protein HemX [Enterovibrio norvegicus]PMH64690.1 heme biosynthesis operon protein HemX [Enterovibrio norvegicus]PMI32849.1 heme biosynthesis operon protein HemX [Enterovibrio norvegicus]